MFCNHCGGAVKPDAQFCPHCGAAFGEARHSPATQAAAAKDPPAAVTAAKNTRPRVNLRRGTAARLGAVLLIIAIGTAITYQFLGATQPTSSAAGSDECQNESSLRSTNGPVDAMLTVTNLSSAPVVVHWINYSGTRERHFEVAPQGSRHQRTPRTYPWIVTTPSGECLQLLSTPGVAVVR